MSLYAPFACLRENSDSKIVNNATSPTVSFLATGKSSRIKEVLRNIAPKDKFLERVRKLCDEKGIILIFDECTSGFRESYGGLHKNYKVFPDMAMFGKALGNGYAITAIIGRRSIIDFDPVSLSDFNKLLYLFETIIL